MEPSEFDADPIVFEVASHRVKVLLLKTMLKFWTDVF
jgi:hypothetical protein